MIAFFLGSHPEVSLAEVRLLFGVKEAERYSSVAFFDIDEELVNKKFFALGGTPRIGKVLATLPKINTENDDLLVKTLKTELSKESRKEYILSLYGVKVDKRGLHHTLKDELPGVKYDGKFEEALHSPAASAHVLQRGGHEFSLISSGEKTYVIKTLQVQDAKFWSIIDGDRPARDMKIGMLPSKLARMMVNFSAVDEAGLLWDPFVGQGTIAMQAAVVKVPLHGTDKSIESISKAKQNMLWLVKKGMVGQAKHSLFQEPIERARIEKNVSGIATEPYLGKPRFKPFTNEFLAKREWREISRIYGTLIQVAHKALHRGQRLVYVKPVFSFLATGGNRWYNPPLSASSDAWKVPELIKDLGPLLWVQKDSVVGREIIILEKR